jgi:citrate lyase subunit beta/citryl-CoA lyase
MFHFRSALFIPGNKRSMLEKAFASTADVIVPDMEDSVPDEEKENARRIVADFLPALRRVGTTIMPRINSLGTGLTGAELDAIVGENIDAISIGKINGPTDISTVSQMIGALEEKRGLTRGSIKLVPWIETAKGVLNCLDICRASKRVVAVAFGAEDFTHDMGIERDDDASQLLYARSAICTAARAAEVLALDTPYFRFRDDDGLMTDCLDSKRLGFKGRFAIHPGQTATINAAYAPSRRDIEEAERVLAAFDAAQQEGRGSTSLDGVVIDVPVAKRARSLLDLAAKFGR